MFELGDSVSETLKSKQAIMTQRKYPIRHVWLGSMGISRLKNELDQKGHALLQTKEGYQYQGMQIYPHSQDEHFDYFPNEKHHS